MRQQEMRSAVDRSVSAQMEEIANEQREISDEQRENALQQTRVANEMRERSEIERQNAIIAERNAVASEKKALEASEVAEAQRQMADHQRIQAELSKRIADTLSYVALARSLGSLSSIQAQLGYTELSDLLAYSSYHFINRYQGDVYYPAIFQSLMTASQSKRSWSKHNGALMKCAYMSDKDDRMVTVSSYGINYQLSIINCQLSTINCYWLRTQRTDIALYLSVVLIENPPPQSRQKYIL